MRTLSFSRLWGNPTDRSTEQRFVYATNEEAKAARDAEYHKLMKQGTPCRRSVLRNQVRQYWGLGIPCGQVCDIYHIDFSS